ncbi:MAG: CHRD domain-containing protein [Actinomycetota bacterium]|nr:CHRD domain-containing protein [Actinomycetota bacterium]
MRSGRASLAHAMAGASLAIIALAGCVTGQDTAAEEPTGSIGGGTPEGGPDTAVAAEGEARTYEVELTGQTEAPEPGDPEGSGSATLVLEPARGEVCFGLVVEGIPEPTGAHVHRGAAGGAGEVLLSLVPPRNGRSEGCVTADESLIDRLAVGPERFYVIVHTEQYPDGALRGQLAGP